MVPSNVMSPPLGSLRTLSYGAEVNVNWSEPFGGWQLSNPLPLPGDARFLLIICVYLSAGQAMKLANPWVLFLSAYQLFQQAVLSALSARVLCPPPICNRR